LADKGKNAVFSAYAFNADRVKSATAVDASYRAPAEGPPPRPKAYILSIGVNAYDDRTLDLRYAANDAKAMLGALSRVEAFEVVPLSLVSDKAATTSVATPMAAKKATIRTVIESLAGGRHDGQGFDKASPDDLVILSFSGHGYTDPNGRFFLVPADARKSEGKLVTDSLISSDELAQWLGGVDARGIVLIIDACHSAASVEAAGFKPGPMGDRTFGQLAYDKGITVLAATQPADSALESRYLGQGVLSYALGEALEVARGRHRGDLNHDGAVTIEEWLEFAEARVPQLYEDVTTGRKQLRPVTGQRDPDILDAVQRQVQVPALYNFGRAAREVTLRASGRSR
jgi:uncharacterized caspase-like protein